MDFFDSATLELLYIILSHTRSYAGYIARSRICTAAPTLADAVEDLALRPNPETLVIGPARIVAGIPGLFSSHRSSPWILDMRTDFGDGFENLHASLQNPPRF